jgi:diguanylate cyclase (GGDEF)-like protein
LAKPDFRTAATVRLKAERSKGLSADVLRLIHAEDHPAAPLAAGPGGAHRRQETQAREGQQFSRRAARPDREGAFRVEPGAGDPYPDATGLETAWTWSAALDSEEKRFARYGVPVTFVVAEVEGLEDLAARLGRDVAEILVRSVGMALRRGTRASDVVVRHGDGRLLAMLPETDEVAAINCVERVRAECDAWLRGDKLLVRLAVGWAQPCAGGRVADAVRLAAERMEADRRRRDIPRR